MEFKVNSTQKLAQISTSEVRIHFMLVLAVCMLIMILTRISVTGFFRDGPLRHSVVRRYMKMVSSVKNGHPKGFLDSLNRYSLEFVAKSDLPDQSKAFVVLGIETSCDDTAAAVVSSDGRILSNVIHSQHEIHEKFGGILPTYAMESHKTMIDQVVSEAVSKAGFSSLKEIDAVAVTRGPGLEICLRVGTRKANVGFLSINPASD